MNDIHHQPAWRDPGRRGRRGLVVGSLVLLVVVAVAGFIFVRHTTQHLNQQGSDALLCAQASGSLQLVPVSDPFHPPVIQVHISHMTAGQVAAVMASAHADTHPWDQEPSGTRVVRCQSGTLKWVVDAQRHAARLPGA